MGYAKRKLVLQMGATHTTHRHSDYWKLKIRDNLTVTRMRDLLKRCGYATGSITDKTWLTDSVLRSDLGLMSYVPYSNDELRAFIATRRIDTTGVYTRDSIGHRRELVQLLDRADQEPQFNDFLLLPAELRNRIYAMHFAEFDQPLSTPSQPPLTLTNRQVRSETLPMFYNSITLDITFIRHLGASFTSMGEVRYRHSVPHQTRSFFHSVGDHNIAQIRRFRFCVKHDRNDPNAISWSAVDEFDSMVRSFEIDLPEEQSRKVELRFVQGVMRGARRPLSERVFRGDVQEWVARMNEREGKIALGLEDVHMLRRAMEML